MKEKIILEKFSNNRHKLFNNILEPSSHALLRHVEMKGIHVVDLGCGEGALTLFMCQLVGADGRVTAVDKDEVKLKRLYEKAKKSGINNLVILHADATVALQKIDNVDMVYSRFFLMHISDPVAMLSQIFQCIKRDACIVLEEPVLSASLDFPKTNFWVKAIFAYEKLCEQTGINPNYGLHLIRDLQSVEFKIHFAQQIQPIISAELAQEYSKYAIYSHQKDYLISGVLNETEYNSLLKTIEQHPIKKIDYCGFHGVMQVVCGKIRALDDFFTHSQLQDL